MTTWTVLKYVAENGRCHFDKWAGSAAVTTKDRAALDRAVDVAEAWETSPLPPEKLKKYHGTKEEIYEFKVKGDKKQLRPLAVVDGNKRIILLCGAVEKDNKLDQGDVDRAERLAGDYRKGKGRVKAYRED